MNAVEELESLLTQDQAGCSGGFDLNAPAEGVSSTQQLLDELLGRFEDDDSTMLLAELYPGHEE